MVLFSNINVNQRVEIKRSGQIFTGTVRFKGHINGESGDWVGVELDEPVGLHTGILHGRQYFHCPAHHGIFTTASQIRFIPLKRYLFDYYKPVRTIDSEIDDSLFAVDPNSHASDTVSNEVWIDSVYQRRAINARFEAEDRYTPNYFPLCHSISSTKPSAIRVSEDVERTKQFGSPSARRPPINVQYDDGPPDYIRPPSIPKIHMPHMALKRQASTGWSKGVHYVREMTVNTGRDSMKYSQWNDIS